MYLYLMITLVQVHLKKKNGSLKKKNGKIAVLLNLSITLLMKEIEYILIHVDLFSML